MHLPIGRRASGVAEGSGHGVYGLSSAGEWETRGVIQLDIGRTLIIEGQISLAKRTWSGELYKLE